MLDSPPGTHRNEYGELVADETGELILEIHFSTYEREQYFIIDEHDHKIELSSYTYVQGWRRSTHSSLALSKNGAQVYELVHPDDHPLQFINLHAQESDPPHTSNTSFDKIGPILSELPKQMVGAVCLADIERVNPTWIWQPYLRGRSINLVEGNHHFINMLFLFDIAARVTTGQAMPDGAPCAYPGNVLIVTNQSYDPPYDNFTLLQVAGADMSRVIFLNDILNFTCQPPEEKTHPFQFCYLDLILLYQYIQKYQPSLLIFPDIISLIPAQQQMEVSSLLHFLRRLLEKYNVTCIISRNISIPGKCDAVTQVERSRSFTDMASKVFLVAAHPTQREQFLFACTKWHDSIEGYPVYNFHIQQAAGKPNQLSLHWNGTCTYSIRELRDHASNTLNPTRKRIHQILARAGNRILSISDIADQLPDLSTETVRRTLQTMGQDGQIAHLFRGAYSSLTTVHYLAQTREYKGIIQYRREHPLY